MDQGEACRARGGSWPRIYRQPVKHLSKKSNNMTLPFQKIKYHRDRCGDRAGAAPAKKREKREKRLNRLDVHHRLILIDCRAFQKEQ